MVASLPQRRQNEQRIHSNRHVAQVLPATAQNQPAVGGLHNVSAPIADDVVMADVQVDVAANMNHKMFQ